MTGWYSEERWVEWVDLLSKDDYLIIEDFLPADLYRQISAFLSEKLQEDEFAKAGMGALHNKQVIASVRGDYTYWLDKARDEKMAPFFSLIDEMISKFNQYCFLSLSGSEFHFAHYPPGTQYERHLDQFKERSNRLISVVFYFNEQWKRGDGGELKIFSSQNGATLVEPKAGSCVLFRSALVEHEVMLTHTDRYSLTGWLLYQPPSLGYLLT